MRLSVIFENKSDHPDVIGFVDDIEDLSVKNDDFRRVLYTGEHCQLVVMSLKPKEDIGEETHSDVDQFFRVEEGVGEVVINGERRDLQSGSAIIVPAGAKHNIINTGDEPLKLYTVYSPPNHKDGTVHVTKADSEDDSESFDGVTTE